MIEQKLQLLSILSNHTIDRGLDVRDMNEAHKKMANEYSEMFNILANDVMNTLYADEIEPENDEEALRQAAEDAGISSDELLKRGESYVSMCLTAEKIDNETAMNLKTLLNKAEAEAEFQDEKEKLGAMGIGLGREPSTEAPTE